MAKRILIIGLLLITLSRIHPVIKSLKISNALALSTDQGDLDPALNATILITMYGFEPAQEQSAGIVTRMAQPGRTEGLGTLISYDGQQFIVTHDHWSLLNSELQLVQFRNGRQELVAEMAGGIFTSLIRYRDGGTMILSKPAMLNDSVKAVLWNNQHSLEKGAVVQVVHRRRDEQGGIAAVGATVEAIEWTDGIPTFRLRSLNGQVIVPGDSGGGIWYEGRLVGNLWMTLTMDIKNLANEQEDTNREANWSRTAVLTRQIQDHLPDTTVENQPTVQPAVEAIAPQQGLPPVMADGGIG